MPIFIENGKPVARELRAWEKPKRFKKMRVRGNVTRRVQVDENGKRISTGQGGRTGGRYLAKQKADFRQQKELDKTPKMSARHTAYMQTVADSGSEEGNVLVHKKGKKSKKGTIANRTGGRRANGSSLRI